MDKKKIVSVDAVKFSNNLAEPISKILCTAPLHQMKECGYVAMIYQKVSTSPHSYMGQLLQKLNVVEKWTKIDCYFFLNWDILWQYTT